MCCGNEYMEMFEMSFSGVSSMLIQKTERNGRI